MATVKVTFTLDELAVTQLGESAERLSLSRSEVVRAAICEYHDRIGRLSEKERLAKLRVIDELLPKLPVRNPTEVRREIRSVRQTRRSGGRLTRQEN